MLSINYLTLDATGKIIPNESTWNNKFNIYYYSDSGNLYFIRRFKMYFKYFRHRINIDCSLPYNITLCLASIIISGFIC